MSQHCRRAVAACSRVLLLLQVVVELDKVHVAWLLDVSLHMSLQHAMQQVDVDCTCGDATLS